VSVYNENYYSVYHIDDLDYAKRLREELLVSAATVARCKSFLGLLQSEVMVDSSGGAKIFKPCLDTSLAERGMGIDLVEGIHVAGILRKTGLLRHFIDWPADPQRGDKYVFADIENKKLKSGRVVDIEHVNTAVKDEPYDGTEILYSGKIPEYF
jgi:hypothetical protein